MCAAADNFSYTSVKKDFVKPVKHGMLAIWHVGHCSELHQTTAVLYSTRTQTATMKNSSYQILHICTSMTSRTCDTEYTFTHTHTQPFNCLCSETTRVGRYQKKHSPTHTHPDHRTPFIIFLHLHDPLFKLQCILLSFYSVEMVIAIWYGLTCCWRNT